MDSDKKFLVGLEKDLKKLGGNEVGIRASRAEPRRINFGERRIVRRKKKIAEKVPDKKILAGKEKLLGKKLSAKNIPTLNLKTERDIAMDFATKIYQRFNKIVKSIILFGSAAKKTMERGSDIDVMVIIDDATIVWDQELVAWYREELEKIVRVNPYRQSLHINTIKLTSWWNDLLRGDPVVVNILRDGESLIDFGGFFEPLKFLLLNGKIKSTPEAIYSLLERAPQHIMRSKAAELSCIEGVYWTMVDASQAALIAANIQPSSPENIAVDLKENFVNTGKLKIKYVLWYRDLLVLHKKILHREITDLKGVEIDDWQEKAEEFLRTMAELVNRIIDEREKM
ncbi:MAG: nucleotidyltransferase domain-containing protein [Nanoarchaeota archaeon]